MYKIKWPGRSLNYDNSDINAVTNVMTSKDTLTQGEYLKEFEKKFAEYHSISNVFATSNAVSALDLICLTMDIKHDDEIIIPAHTYCATAIPFFRKGATIRWADIDDKTFLISAESIKSLINKKTKAIVIVHLYGSAAEMKDIVKIAQDNNITLIEDCAQALGAKYNEKIVGTFGDYSIWSFQSQKNISTLGEGGMLYVKDDNIAQKIPGIRHNGHKPFENNRENYWTPAMVNVTQDIDGVWPMNYCLTEVQCALGSNLLSRINVINEKRIKIAEEIINALKSFEELSFQHIPSYITSTRHLLPARWRPNKSRDQFMKIMSQKYSIQMITQYYPLNRYELFEDKKTTTQNLENTNKFFDNMVSFPFSLTMSNSDFDYMIESCIKTIEELKTNNV